MGVSQRLPWKLRWSWLLGLAILSLCSLDAHAIELDLDDEGWSFMLFSDQAVSQCQSFLLAMIYD